MGRPNIRQYSSARCIRSGFAIGRTPSLKATAPASTNVPISASSFLGYLADAATLEALTNYGYQRPS